MTINPKVSPQDVVEIYGKVERYVVDKLPNLDNARANSEIIVNLVITELGHRGYHVLKPEVEA